MKLRRIQAANTKAGLKRLEMEFNRDTYILSNTRQNGSNVFLIATDSPVATAAQDTTKPFDRIYQEQVEKISEPPRPAARHKDKESRDETAMLELAGLIRQEFDAVKSDLLQLQFRVGGQQTNSREALLLDLVEWGIPHAILLQLRAHLDGPEGMTELEAVLRTILSEQLPERLNFSADTGVHVLVGNHGAGKTLMAIRLANWLRQRQQDAIVVGYRDDKEGAWSQLQLLGAKSDITVYRANRAEDLHAITLEYRDCSHVIVDAAASHTPARLRELHTALPYAEFHLVAPCDAYYASLNRFFGAAAPVFRSILLSRLDLDGPSWPILRLLIEHRLAFSLASVSADARETLMEVHKHNLIEPVLEQFHKHFSGDVPGSIDGPDQGVSPGTVP